MMLPQQQQQKQQQKIVSLSQRSNSNSNSNNNNNRLSGDVISQQQSNKETVVSASNAVAAELKGAPMLSIHDNDNSSSSNDGHFSHNTLDEYYKEPMYFGTENSTTVNTQIGANAHLPCTVHHIGEGVVSICLISSNIYLCVSLFLFLFLSNSHSHFIPLTLNNPSALNNSDAKFKFIWKFMHTWNQLTSTSYSSTGNNCWRQFKAQTLSLSIFQ